MQKSVKVVQDQIRLQILSKCKASFQYHIKNKDFLANKLFDETKIC